MTVKKIKKNTYLLASMMLAGIFSVFMSKNSTEKVSSSLLTNTAYADVPTTGGSQSSDGSGGDAGGSGCDGSSDGDA